MLHPVVSSFVVCDVVFSSGGVRSSSPVSSCAGSLSGSSTANGSKQMVLEGCALCPAMSSCWTK